MITYPNIDNAFEWGPNKTNDTGRNDELKLAKEKKTQSASSQWTVSEGKPQKPLNLDMEQDLVREGNNFYKLGESSCWRAEKRRSIHQSMRSTIESIRALYKLTEIEWRDEKAKEAIRKNNSLQTTLELNMSKKEEYPEWRLLEPETQAGNDIEAANGECKYYKPEIGGR